MVMTLGGRGREIASGSRPSGSHSKVQGSIMRPCLKTRREREGNIEVVDGSQMGSCNIGHQHTVAWVSIRLQTDEGHQGVNPKDSLLMDRLNTHTAK